MTQTWQVEPSGPLRGDITVRGSKNAVTKHMVAAMLGDGPSVIRNAPQVGDVDITAAMLEAVGFHVGREGGEITIAPGERGQAAGARDVHRAQPDPDPDARPAAAPGRRGVRPAGRRGPDRAAAGRLPRRGADGARARRSTHGPTGITAKATRLRGARITLPYPSVGATETVLLSAVLAEGKTVLRNAATEPEVVELALFLQRMGAQHRAQPDRRIVIEGVRAS